LNTPTAEQNDLDASLILLALSGRAACHEPKADRKAVPNAKRKVTFKAELKAELKANHKRICEFLIGADMQLTAVMKLLWLNKQQKSPYRRNKSMTYGS
jgi:hypothetical protein